MNNTLPLDIVLAITRFCVWTPTVCPRSSQIELTKHKFNKGMAGASRDYRDLYISEWSRLMVLDHAADWGDAVKYGLAQNVRTLILGENALPNHAQVKAHLNLAEFKLIHTLVLDCHNDVGCGKSSGTQGQWSYKRVLPIFPRGLKSLVILNAHGPDLQVIQRAIEQCSDLEQLSLGRCTKFNRPDNCDFWKQFPDDHDSYFSVKGTDGYADALGNELRALTKLESVYVNVYLTDTKYLSHPTGDSTPNDNPTLPPHERPAPTDSTTPIPPIATGELGTIELDSSENEHHPDTPSTPESRLSQLGSTESQDERATKEAEKEAVEILFGSHPNLKIAAFISYWSKDHLGWSSHKREAREYAYISPHKAPDPGEEPPRNKDPEGNKQG